MRLIGVVVTGLTRAIDADAFVGVGLPVGHVDVGLTGRARRVEITDVRAKRDILAVAGDVGPEGGARGLASVLGQVHALGDIGDEVPHEDVLDHVRVERDEVVRFGVEGDEATIATDLRVPRHGVAGRTECGHRDAFRRTGGTIPHENLTDTERAARSEVRRERNERDHVAVVTDGRRVHDIAVAWNFRVGNADAFGDAGVPIVEEHVAVRVRVTGYEVRRRRREHDVATVRRQARSVHRPGVPGQTGAALTVARDERTPGQRVAPTTSAPSIATTRMRFLTTTSVRRPRR